MSVQKESHPKLILKKTIHAKREKVFDAWTKPELMQRWFFPGDMTAKTTNELRVGGSYSHNMISDGSAPSCSPEEKPKAGEIQENLHHGEYLEILPPERLVFTWNSKAVTNTRVTVELKEIGDETELTLTHELLESEDMRTRHNAGRNGCLENLERFFN